MHRKVFKLLGFEPVPLDVKDLLIAVQSGRIEAQENPLTTIYNFGLHTYHRHITLTGHLFGAAVVLCHQASYAAWPAEIRQALTEAVAEATAVQRCLATAADDEVLGRLHPAQNEIVRLTDAERALFVEAVASLVDEQRQVFGNQLFGYLRA
jgi:TRAP-type C4-dicarboxylate transport system substrate-binding protein